MKTILISLFIFLGSLTLQGCTKNLMDTANTVVKAATPINVKYPPNDNELSLAAIDNIISSDLYQKDMRINIVVNDGHILLIGQVDTQENSKKIEEALLKLDGVKEVYNQLRITKSIGFYQQMKDGWTTAKVKTQLAKHDKINPFKIKVVTENSEVFLVGSVTKEMAYYATFITRQVTGVGRVIKVFELIPE